MRYFQLYFGWLLMCLWGWRMSADQPFIDQTSGLLISTTPTM